MRFFFRKVKGIRLKNKPQKLFFTFISKILKIKENTILQNRFKCFLYEYSLYFKMIKRIFKNYNSNFLKTFTFNLRFKSYKIIKLLKNKINKRYESELVGFVSKLKNLFVNS